MTKLQEETIKKLKADVQYANTETDEARRSNEILRDQKVEHLAEIKEMGNKIAQLQRTNAALLTRHEQLLQMSINIASAIKRE